MAFFFAGRLRMSVATRSDLSINTVSYMLMVFPVSRLSDCIGICSISEVFCTECASGLKLFGDIDA